MKNMINVIIIKDVLNETLEMNSAATDFLANAVMKSDTHKKKSKKREWLKVNNENYIMKSFTKE